VGREDLDRRQSISLARTLERLPGVRTLSTGREIGKPVIRGSTGARVAVLLEGMRMEDYAWSYEDAPAIDAAMADRSRSFEAREAFSSVREPWGAS
jgi:iron complex outermembrane receptor protein